MIDHTISVIKNLQAPRDKKSELAGEITRATESLTRLKHLVAEIPGQDAKKIREFATDPKSGWLMNDDDNGKKYEKFRAILKSP